MRANKFYRKPNKKEEAVASSVELKELTTTKTRSQNVHRRRGGRFHCAHTLRRRNLREDSHHATETLAEVRLRLTRLPIETHDVLGVESESFSDLDWVNVRIRRLAGADVVGLEEEEDEANQLLSRPFDERLHRIRRTRIAVVVTVRQDDHVDLGLDARLVLDLRRLRESQMIAVDDGLVQGSAVATPWTVFRGRELRQILDLVERDAVIDPDLVDIARENDTPDPKGGNVIFAGFFHRRHVFIVETRDHKFRDRLHRRRGVDDEDHDTNAAAHSNLFIRESLAPNSRSRDLLVGESQDA
jgi:hypothetical protein